MYVLDFCNFMKPFELFRLVSSIHYASRHCILSCSCLPQAFHPCAKFKKTYLRQIRWFPKQNNATKLSIPLWNNWITSNGNLFPASPFCSSFCKSSELRSLKQFAFAHLSSFRIVFQPFLTGSRSSAKPTLSMSLTVQIIWFPLTKAQLKHVTGGIHSIIPHILVYGKHNSYKSDTLRNILFIWRDGNFDSDVLILHIIS